MLLAAIRDYSLTVLVSVTALGRSRIIPFNNAVVLPRRCWSTACLRHYTVIFCYFYP